VTTPAPDVRRRMAPRVNHRLFVLLDPRAPESPQESALPEGDEILRAGRYGVVFLSGGDLFRPDVTVEVWPEAPGPDAGEWDEAAEAEFDAPSGTVRLKSIMGGKAGPDVAVAAGRVGLRAYTRGRGEAMERLGVEVGYEGVEEWLLQLWPAGS
jgi:hypothetical protein